MIALGVSAQAWAQDEADALRYSRLTTGGTARTQAIGGAAGSLGGDITATHVNPAGLGFFRTSEVVITPGFNFRTNKQNYLGTATDANNNNFTLGNLGIVFGMPTSNSSSGWRNVAFSLDYNRLADFNNKLYIDGVNTTTSYVDRWVNRLNNNGSPLSFNDAASIDPLGASLAFNTFLVDTINGGYATWVDPTAPGGIRQRDRVSTEGGLNEFSLGMGANYSDKLYVGLSLNFPTLRFERTRTFAEDDLSGNNNNDFAYFEHTERLKTDGVGFNAKLGAIYAPVPNVRIGAAFHTPTWYNMRDATTARVQVDTEGYQPDGQSERYQDTEELTDGLPVEYEYSLQTPWRAMGSFSYIFGTDPDVKQQHGFITADVEYVDYASAKYRFNKGTEGDRDFARQLNSSMDNLYKGAVNVRVGGELKFNVIAVRAGYAYYGSPYQNSDIKANTQKISGGLGYRNKGFFADLTYVHTLTKDEYQPYTLAGSKIAPATVDGTVGSVLMTVGFKF